MLTPKQEAFARYLFEGNSQRESWIKAGYSSNMSPENIDTKACHLAAKDKVKSRMNELKTKAEDTSVATVLERKRVATQGIRGELREIEVIENQDGTKIKKIRTVSRAPFIAELNKMEKIYTDAPTVNVDNRSITIVVETEESKRLTEEIMAGKGTES